ncbi:hypothetical protein KIPB_003174, partial [Kipferlia bialata]
PLSATTKPRTAKSTGKSKAKAKGSKAMRPSPINLQDADTSATDVIEALTEELADLKVQFQRTLDTAQQDPMAFARDDSRHALITHLRDEIKRKERQVEKLRLYR